MQRLSMLVITFNITFLLQVFRRHLLASPNTSLIKTPRSCQSWDSFSDLSFREATAFEDLARRLV